MESPAIPGWFTHTLQRKGPLLQICDAYNHVMTFRLPYRRADGGPGTVGWKQASTFPGFCANHDQVFAPLENRRFESTAQQCFLATYRAVCYEYYMKCGGLRGLEKLKRLCDRRPAEFADGAGDDLAFALVSQTTGRQNAERIKLAMDRDLLVGNFGNWTTTVISMRGPVSITAAGCMTPDVDFGGNVLQDFADLHTPTQNLVCSTIDIEEGLALCIAHRLDEPVPAQYLRTLLDLPRDRVPQVLSQVLFAHIENTYFDVGWWHGLRPMQQKHVGELAVRVLGPHEGVKLIRSELVPWSIDNIRVIGGEA